MSFGSVGELSLCEEWTGGAILNFSGTALALGDGTFSASGGAVATFGGEALILGEGDFALSGGATATFHGEALRLAGGDFITITVTPAFFDLVTRPDGSMQYLVEMMMVPGGDADFTVGGGMGSVGEFALLEEPAGAEIDIGEVEELLSDRDYAGAYDDPFRPNAYYDARLLAALVIEKRLPLMPEEPRRAARQYGFVEIANRDGEWTERAASMAVDGRRIRVLAGPLNSRYINFQPIADVLGSGIEEGPDVVRVTVRDRALSLDRVLLRATYGGTGGYDGNEELAGKHRPWLSGYCFNVTPVPLDPFFLVYEVHQGRINAVLSVYDRGVALSLDTAIGTGGDVANYAALTGAEIASGHYITCLALGLFRLGSSPTFVTCTVEGDAPSGVYAETVGAVAYRIATGPGDVPTSQVNEAGFASLPAYACGLFISSADAASKTGADVLGEILGSAGAYWDVSVAGFLRAGRHAPPETSSVQYRIDTTDILDVSPREKPRIRWKSPVGYARNWTVQRGEDVADSVSDERRQQLAESQRIAGSDSENLNILLRQPESFAAPPYPSLLRYEADAEEVASLNMKLHGTPRQMFDIVTSRLGLLPETDIGNTVSLSWPGYGLRNRRNWRVIGKRIDTSRDVVVQTVWG